MRKLLLSLIAITTICTNVWGADEETDTYIWKETPKQLTIKASGFANGVISNYSTSNQPWYGVLSKVKQLIVQEGITTIGKNAFYNAQYLESVTLPISLTSIKSNAFCDASKSLSKDDTLHYAGSPSEWASVSISYRYAHPLQRAGHYYFYGSDSETSILVLSPTITEVKRLAFYNGKFSDVCVPGTITNIRDSAFRCSISTSLAVNRSAAPSLGTNALSAYSKPLYVPSTNSGYTGSPWSSYTKTTQDVSGETMGDKGANVSWALNSNGVLTLDATNGAKTLNVDAANSSMPWLNFRRLVYKVVIKGGVTALNNTLRYLYGLSEITLEQNNIPTADVISSLSTVSANSFSSLFNSRDNVVLKIKSASLADATVSNLGSDPWDNAKLDIQLSDNLEISDDDDYTNLIDSCKKYVEKPITLQLGRSLTNAQYNTFCSPIPMTAGDISSKFGGADIRKLESSSLDGEDLTLTFSASSLEGIEAGKPYLVRPTTEVANPTFENIAPSSLVSATENTETTYADFIGVLAPTLLNGGNKNTLFLGAGNELFWPEADGNIRGMRAYFSVKGAAQKNGIRARIVMNKEVATGIEDVRSESAGAVRSEKILRNGQIIIIRDGKEYNVMGIMIK